jgi:hypothetical protein
MPATRSRPGFRRPRRRPGTSPRSGSPHRIGMSKPWEVVKDVLYPGRVVVPGPGGRPISYTFTPADAARIAATGNAMLRAGFHAPACWEHQNVGPEKVRLSRAARDREYAKSVFAHVGRFDVAPDGRVLARIRGADPADLRQFEKVRFVSPEIQWDWMDSDGKTWAGPTITHVAATPRPVQRHQHPVGTLALSHAANARAFADFRAFLGAAAGGGNVAPTISPRGPLRLSLSHYQAGSNMAGELDGFGGFSAGDGADADAGGKQTPWARIAAALSEHCGIDLGDVSDVQDADTFAMLVEVAARNYKAGSEPDQLDDELPEEEEDPTQPAGDLAQPPPGATEPPMPPVQMSLRKQQAQAETFARRNLAARLARLDRTGRVTPTQADGLRKELTAVRLSFTAAGDLAPSALTAKLDALEQNPAGAARGKPGKVRLSNAPRGTRAAGRSAYEDDKPAQTQAEVDATADAFFKGARGGR